MIGRYGMVWLRLGITGYGPMDHGGSLSIDIDL